jgi:hypothetical protein
VSGGLAFERVGVWIWSGISGLWDYDGMVERHDECAMNTG